MSDTRKTAWCIEVAASPASRFCTRNSGEVPGLGVRDRGAEAHDDLGGRIADAVDLLQAERRLVELREGDHVAGTEPNGHHRDLGPRPDRPSRRHNA